MTTLPKRLRHASHQDGAAPFHELLHEAAARIEVLENVCEIVIERATIETDPELLRLATEVLKGERDDG